MKGLDLCRRYFQEVAWPLVQARFPDWVDRMACGLFGAGSDVFGYDDEISRDHNWGPRFRLVLSPDDYDAIGEHMLGTLLAELPAEFEGYKIRGFPPGRGNRQAQVESLASVKEWALGYPEVPADDVACLGIAEHRLFELHSGEIWHDPRRLLLGLREATAYFPEMVWRKRMAFAWESLFFGANFFRSARRGDRFAEQMYLSWSLQCIMRLTFLLNRRYAPYRKWLHRAFRELPLLAQELDPLLAEMFDGTSAEAKGRAFRAALESLGRATNELGIIDPQPLDGEAPLGIGFNFYGFASALQDTITGPLAQLSYADGAPDQWAFDLGTAKPLQYPDIVRALFAGSAGADEHDAR